MIFLGSKKYPGEAQFEEFLSENGGESNAYTECEYTSSLAWTEDSLELPRAATVRSHLDECQTPSRACEASTFL